MPELSNPAAPPPTVFSVTTASPVTSGSMTTGPGANPPVTNPPPTTPPKRRRPPADGTRETVESIVIAFILAFLFRTFEAEAFVIPTGSMAPTLYGQHRDVICKQCRTRFAVGASDEFLDGNDGGREEVRSATIDERKRSHTAICPNCRYPNFVYNDEMFTGDRILVNKYPYDLGQMLPEFLTPGGGSPDRFDVIVFKYPNDAKTNYIKRLIGLPGEQLAIIDGDIYVRKPTTENPHPIFQIARKAPDKQRDLQMLVYDDDHPPLDLLELGWPERWQTSSETGWTRDKNLRIRTLRVDPDADNPEMWRSVGYRHTVPSSDDWQAVRESTPEKPSKLYSAPAPELIVDYCAYNARVAVSSADQQKVVTGKFPSPDDAHPLLGADEYGQFWVGDLTMSCTIETLSDSGELQWELTEGSRIYRARIDVKTGLATFGCQDFNRNPEQESALDSQGVATPLIGRGTHQVSFANVDNRICLWVDGRLVKAIEFNEEAGDPVFLPATRPVMPTDRDLQPATISARGVSAVLSHLKLERDIYYRSAGDMKNSVISTINGNTHSVDPNDHTFRIDASKLKNPERLLPFTAPEALTKLEKLSSLQFELISLRAALASPERWSDSYSKYKNGISEPQYDLLDSANDQDDEFLVLGDNSPRSADSRFWPNERYPDHEYAVKRRLLVGKAFFIYWPHAVPFLNDGKGFGFFPYSNIESKAPKVPGLSLPSYPQFGRMSRIR